MLLLWGEIEGEDGRLGRREGGAIGGEEEDWELFHLLEGLESEGELGLDGGDGEKGSGDF